MRKHADSGDLYGADAATALIDLPAVLVRADGRTAEVPTMLRQHSASQSGLAWTVCDVDAAARALRSQWADLVMVDTASAAKSPDQDVVALGSTLAALAESPPLVVVMDGHDQVIEESLMEAGVALVLSAGDPPELVGRLLVQVARRHRAWRDARGHSSTHLEVSVATVEPDSQSYSSPTLEEASPRLFAELCQSYQELTRHRLEEMGLKVDHDVSHRARRLAGRLLLLRASARDVALLHRSALRALVADVSPARARALVDSGESLLVATLGHLSDAYRQHSLGVVPRAWDVDRRREMSS